MIGGIDLSPIFVIMKKYILEGFEDSSTPDMKYYSFDWDDNIVSMPTKIILKTDNGDEVGMGTEDFAEHRHDIGKKDIKSIETNPPLMLNEEKIKLTLCNTLKEHNNIIYNLSLSPCGQFLACSGFDKIINIWNIIT